MKTSELQKSKNKVAQKNTNQNTNPKLPEVRIGDRNVVQMLNLSSMSMSQRQHLIHDIGFMHGNRQAQQAVQKAQAVNTVLNNEKQNLQTDPNNGSGSQVIQLGIFGKIWKGIKKAASSVSGAVKKVAGTVWGGIKKGANWVAGAAKKVWSGIKWFGSQMWDKITGIFHRITHWMAKLPQRIGRLLIHLWQGVKSLKPWSLKWWESLGKADTWMNLLEWLGTNLIYLAETAGVGEAYETLMDFVKFNTRTLKSDEIAKARTVFGGAIDYALVRVDEQAILGPSWGKHRPYVSFHTINAWGNLDDHTLIHELTHVWQYEKMGAIYMPKALHAQKAGGYNYGGIADLKRRKDAKMNLWSYNLEQQGDILADYYVGRSGGTLSGESLAIYEYFVKDVRK